MKRNPSFLSSNYISLDTDSHTGQYINNPNNKSVTITHLFRGKVEKNTGYISFNEYFPKHILIVAPRCVLGLYINMDKIISIDIL
jgi:hypothetical protein